MSQPIVRILDVPFTNMTHRDLIDTLVARALNNLKTFVVTANPEIVMHAQKNLDYKHLLDRVDYITADGIGIIKAAQLMRQPLPERVSGYDIMMDLLKEAESRHLKVFLLGAEESINAITAERIHLAYPNLRLVGRQHGYFDWEDSSLVEQIKLTEPDFVFVALGFPLQERWIHQHFDQFNKGIFIGVGGSFDVLSGHIQRAPKIWRKLNVEWLYRLIKQPSRWRRMAVLPEFVLAIVKEKRK